MLPLLIALTVHVSAQPAGTSDVSAGNPSDDARRVVAILDYVASDYGGAVRDGAVLSADEYAEQQGFVADAARLVARLPASELDAPAGVAVLQRDITALADPKLVATDAATLRAGLVRAYNVVLVPGAPLSRTNGAALYMANCASCHGATGGADTDLAHQLTPPPRNFRDPATMHVLTPARAFNALADGVSGTAMPSFSQLSLPDRWDLAFYVFTLRHDANAEQRGATTATDLDIATLAAANDEVLENKLPNLSTAQQTDAVAWLRGVAPYRNQDRTMAVARNGIDDALTVFRAGDHAEAGRRLTDTYLRGFEPHEALLRQTAPDLVTRIEDGFLGLRAAMDANQSIAEVEAKAATVRVLLDDAESSASSTGGTSMAFAGGFLVFLREGVEAALVVLLLLGYARTRGPREVWSVHAGWLLAALAGGVTWLASGWLVAVAGAQREAVEGFTALLAAAFMVSAHHWLASRAESARRVGEIRAVMGTAVLAWWTLPALAFGAVYREAFEVVLFLQAIILDSTASPAAVAAGCLTATLLLIVAVALLLRLGRKLPVGPALTAASVLLCGMAVVFAGKGVHALQEAGDIGVHANSFLRVEWIGLFPTWETMVVQAIFVVILAGSAVAPRFFRDSATLKPGR